MGFIDTKQGDALVEAVLLIVIALLVLNLYRWRRMYDREFHPGMRMIVTGLILLCPALALDISDSIKGLERYEVIGDTEAENYLEIAIYTAAFVFITAGFRAWFKHPSGETEG